MGCEWYEPVSCVVLHKWVRGQKCVVIVADNDDIGMVNACASIDWLTKASNK